MTDAQVLETMNRQLVGKFGVAMVKSKPISLGYFRQARRRGQSMLIMEFSCKSVSILLDPLIISTIGCGAENELQANDVYDNLFIGDQELQYHRE